MTDDPAFDVTMLPPEDLIPWPGNPRVNDRTDDLETSVEHHGWLHNLVVWIAHNDAGDLPEGMEAGRPYVVAGNRRLLAARARNDESVPVLVHEFASWAEAAAFNVQDNRSSDLGGWHDGRLSVVVQQLPEDLQRLTAFTIPEIQQLEHGIGIAALREDWKGPGGDGRKDPGPTEVEGPVYSKRGEVYVLGQRAKCPKCQRMTDV